MLSVYLIKEAALTEKYLTKELYDAIEEVDTNEVFQSMSNVSRRM